MLSTTPAAVVGKLFWSVITHSFLQIRVCSYSHSVDSLNILSGTCRLECHQNIRNKPIEERANMCIESAEMKGPNTKLTPAA